MDEPRICIRRAALLRCDQKAIRWAPYCHKCLRQLRENLQSGSNRERALRFIADDCAAVGGLDPARTAAAVETDLRMRCVRCQQRAVLSVGGRFCSNACAVRWAVSLAQTKQWDAAAEEWSPVAPETPK